MPADRITNLTVSDVDHSGCNEHQGACVATVQWNVGRATFSALVKLSTGEFTGIVVSGDATIPNQWTDEQEDQHYDRVRRRLPAALEEFSALRDDHTRHLAATFGTYAHYGPELVAMLTAFVEQARPGEPIEMPKAAYKHLQSLLKRVNADLALASNPKPVMPEVVSLAPVNKGATTKDILNEIVAGVRPAAPFARNGGVHG